MSNTSTSSNSTLYRLQANPRDELAWARFIRRYGPVIHNWCRARGAAQQAEEVTSRILQKLWSMVCRRQEAERRGEEPRPVFDPSQGIRRLVVVMARQALADLWRQRRREVPPASEEDFAAAELDQAKQDLKERLEQEYQSELLEAARARAQQRVEPATWQCYWLTEREQLSPQEAAVRLDLKVSQVYVNKNRVLTAIKQELERLREEEREA